MDFSQLPHIFQSSFNPSTCFRDRTFARLWSTSNLILLQKIRNSWSLGNLLAIISSLSRGGSVLLIIWKSITRMSKLICKNTSRACIILIVLPRRWRVAMEVALVIEAVSKWPILGETVLQSAEKVTLSTITNMVLSLRKAVQKKTLTNYRKIPF